MFCFASYTVTIHCMLQKMPLTPSDAETISTFLSFRLWQLSAGIEWQWRLESHPKAVCFQRRAKEEMKSWVSRGGHDWFGAYIRHIPSPNNVMKPIHSCTGIDLLLHRKGCWSDAAGSSAFSLRVEINFVSSTFTVKSFLHYLTMTVSSSIKRMTEGDWCVETSVETRLCSREPLLYICKLICDSWQTIFNIYV